MKKEFFFKNHAILPNQLQPFPIEIGKNGLDNFEVLDMAFGAFSGVPTVLIYYFLMY